MRFATILLASAPLLAQTFEVASVVPSAFPSGPYAAGFRAAVTGNPCTRMDPKIAGTLITFDRVEICDLIRYAYDLKNYQVIGIPKTLGFSGQDKPAPVPIQQAIANSDQEPAIFYDIEARAPGSEPPTVDQVREMLRALLAQRFHLEVHREQRDFAFYALVVAKNGPANLKAAREGCKPHGGPGLMTACGRTMEDLARNLTARTDKTVVDMTGLTGKFDYEVSYEISDTPDLNTAILASVQQTLKLKLEPRKGPLDVLVVDHVERPSAN